MFSGLIRHKAPLLLLATGLIVGAAGCCKKKTDPFVEERERRAQEIKMKLQASAFDEKVKRALKFDDKKFRGLAFPVQRGSGRCKTTSVTVMYNPYQDLMAEAKKNKEANATLPYSEHKDALSVKHVPACN